MCNFLVNTLPESLPLFYIENFEIDPAFTMEPTDIQSITRTASRVTEEFYFSKGKMSKQNFVQILEAARKWQVVTFYNCEFGGESEFNLNSEL